MRGHRPGASPDGRTRAAKIPQLNCNEWLKKPGREPTSDQLVLIEQAGQFRRRIAAMDPRK
jgi:hypothetical protein